MALLFRVVSPHNGAEVVCSSKQWNDHILDHPEMAGAEEAVMRTISQPFAIYQSDSHVTRQVFYRPSSELPPPFGRGYIRVIVEYRNRRWPGSGLVGTVITAFHVPGPKSAEVIIWP